MSSGADDDSRPSRPPSGPLISQRPTARDVPIAKYKEPSSAPRGLRGQSLLPGQGAPERIVPEDVELAVLREADTLDGLHVARAKAGRGPDVNSSPPPTPVSVEVPRVRSIPPGLEPYGTPPSTPSARSVQSGTLMSIGSVDPRAPTELSLPSPRTLSQSERAAYLGPGAVVDRTPVSVSALASTPRDLVNLAQRVELAEATPRQGPHSEPMPHSSARSVPVGSGPPVSSARRSQRADSPAPHARHFGRAPESYSPLSHTPAPSPPHTPSQPPSLGDAPPQFEIHAQLDAVPHEFMDDNFDLRSVSTLREPLASRKPMESADWSTVHEPVSARRDSAVPSERTSRAPNSSSAITIRVDRVRDVAAPYRESRDSRDSRDSMPSGFPPPPQRASVPVSWVLGAAAFALALALLVAWVMRAPTVPAAAVRAVDAPTPVAPGAAVGTALPSLQSALPAAKAGAASAERPGLPSAALAPSVGGAPKPLLAASAAHGAETMASSAASVRSLPAASARAGDGRESRAPGVSSADANAGAKPVRSIY